jgi:hypothetical protein
MKYFLRREKFNNNDYSGKLKTPHFCEGFGIKEKIVKPITINSLIRGLML